MNLYSSFGNLMEAWVQEDRTALEPSWLESHSEEELLTPSSDMGPNPSSESVDSGVETASCDTPNPTAMSTDSGEMDPLTEQSGGASPASPCRSPAPSSPVAPSSISSSPCPSSSRGESVSGITKVEQALQRTVIREPKQLIGTSLDLLDATFTSQQCRPDSEKCQNSETVTLRKRVDSFAPVRQKSGVPRRPVSFACDRTETQDFTVDHRKEMSPGLWYLEQVCQMLEEVARKQVHPKAAQAELDLLQEEDAECDSAAAGEELFSVHTFENEENSDICRNDQQPKSRHYRQRSASDTTLTTIHLKKLNSSLREQRLSTNDLIETVSEAPEERENSPKKGPSKSSMLRNLKIGSLKKGLSASSVSKSQQMQPFEKRAVVRRLSQMFKRKKVS